jgi:hypothetical protein
MGAWHAGGKELHLDFFKRQRVTFSVVLEHVMTYRVGHARIVARRERWAAGYPQGRYLLDA